MENSSNGILVDDGGKGGAVGLALVDPSHARSNAASLVRWLDQMGAKQIPIDVETVQQINTIAADLGKAKSPRLRNMGAKLAQAALRYNLDLAQAADKLSRLDEGKPTENIAHRVYQATFDRQG